MIIVLTHIVILMCRRQVPEDLGNSSYSGLEDEVVGMSLVSPLPACFVAMATSPSKLSIRSSAWRHCISDKKKKQWVLKTYDTAGLDVFLLTIMLLKETGKESASS